MRSLMVTSNMNINFTTRDYELESIKEFCKETNTEFQSCSANTLTMLGLNLETLPTAYINITGYPNDQHYRFLKYLELNNVKCVNDVNSEIFAFDKMISYLQMKYNGIEVIDTISLGHIFDNPMDKVIEQIEDLIGYPCVIKPTRLGRGMGIVKCDDRYQLSEIIGLIFSSDARKIGAVNHNNFIVQKFVHTAFGKRYRLVLYKDNPLLFMLGRNTEGYWKVNSPTTSEREVFEPPYSVVELGMKIHKVLNINYSALDLHIAEDRFIINEVNPCPELRMIDKLANQKILHLVLKDLFEI